MDKRTLSERDICTKFITPALRQAGWDEMSQIREEVGFTKGRIIVRGKLVTRGKAKRADYVLHFKPNIPIAIIEAKDNNHSVGDGMQQALDYAATLVERGRLRVSRPLRDQRREGGESRTQRLSIAFRSLGEISRLERPDAGSRGDRPSGLFRRRQR
jgi:type I site-specific restriction endonuclease